VVAVMATAMGPVVVVVVVMEMECCCSSYAGS
jgi:hypothetical protein